MRHVSFALVSSSDKHFSPCQCHNTTTDCAPYSRRNAADCGSCHLLRRRSAITRPSCSRLATTSACGAHRKSRRLPRTRSVRQCAFDSCCVTALTAAQHHCRRTASNVQRATPRQMWTCARPMSACRVGQLGSRWSSAVCSARRAL